MSNLLNKKTLLLFLRDLNHRVTLEPKIFYILDLIVKEKLDSMLKEYVKNVKERSGKILQKKDISDKTQESKKKILRVFRKYMKFFKRLIYIKKRNSAKQKEK